MLLTRSNVNSANEGVYNPKFCFNRGTVAQTGYIPDGAQLLQDVWPLKILDTKQVMLEGAAGGIPATRITGLFQIADDLNANGRVYPSSVIREAVEAIQEDLANRSVWGEFDHPSDAKLHLDRVSHLILKIWMEGKNVYGEAEICDDLPYGQQLKSLIRRGRIGISSRGIGDMEVSDNGGREVYTVTEGYRFVTWDAVAEPSVSGAILHICEGKLHPVKMIQKVPKKNGIFDRRIYERKLGAELAEALRRK